MGTIPDEGKVEHFRSMGIDEIVLGVIEGPRDEMLATLDRYADIVEPFRG